jgi:hypothetical protein
LGGLLATLVSCNLFGPQPSTPPTPPPTSPPTGDTSLSGSHFLNDCRVVVRPKDMIGISNLDVQWSVVVNGGMTELQLELTANQKDIHMWFTTVGRPLTTMEKTKEYVLTLSNYQAGDVNDPTKEIHAKLNRVSPPALLLDKKVAAIGYFDPSQTSPDVYLSPDTGEYGILWVDYKGLKTPIRLKAN